MTSFFQCNEEKMRHEGVHLNNTNQVSSVLLRCVILLIEEGDSLKVEAIDYLMVSVDDMAEGLYSLRNARLKLSGNRLLLAVNVKRYHPFNNGWAQIGRYGSGDVVPLERLLDK